MPEGDLPHLGDTGVVCLYLSHDLISLSLDPVQRHRLVIYSLLVPDCLSSDIRQLEAKEVSFRRSRLGEISLASMC